MTTRRRFPNWVPDAIVESYVELADWLDAKGAGSAEDADMSDIRQQLSDGIECLEAVMIAPTMRGAWISLGKRSDHRHYRFLIQEIQRQAYHLANPNEAGSLDTAERLAELSKKMRGIIRIVSSYIDIDSEYFSIDAELGTDGNPINVVYSELRESFTVSPTEALEHLCDWLDRQSESMASYARRDTKQPRDSRAPEQKLIRSLSRLMYQLYERPLDDVVAALAETILAHFGSEKTISRGQVIGLRKSSAAT